MKDKLIDGKRLENHFVLRECPRFVRKDVRNLTKFLNERGIATICPRMLMQLVIVHPMPFIVERLIVVERKKRALDVKEREKQNERIRGVEEHKEKVRMAHIVILGVGQ